MEAAKKEDYNFKESEARIQKFWQDNNIYQFNGKSGKKIFSIDTPPPTVSGRMHMGHGFSYILIDIIARLRRMQGNNVFYPFGLDDNGIATNLMIEKNLNLKAKNFTRGKWIEIAEKETEKIEDILLDEFKSLGLARDWSQVYRTINKYATKQAQRSFIDIYNQGRAYRVLAPSLFCTNCETAISQVELQDKELESMFNDVVFKIGKEEVVIATTRPELLPACVAVFYNPQDKRYKKLKGKKAIVPLFDFGVLILEDKRVDMEKGTGIVMCCTFGDQTDMEWQKAWNLEIKEAITKEGKMSELAGKYKGMGVKEAREKIIQDLKEKGLLKKQERIKHMVNVHERCGKEVEIINTRQWFVKYLDLKSKFLEQGKKIKWHPEHMRVRYDNWVNGLQWNWCISRQKYFGVPIPAWYCKKCSSVLVPEDKELPIDPLKDKPEKKCKCGSSEFEPEKDTFDTWFISSLTPQIACKWKEDEKLFKKLFPMSLRPQGQEIISFWAFNTIVKALLHNKDIPWKDIMVHGWILDPYGEKMSKSLGNIIMPYTIIEKYSADAMRYWAASISLGDDSAFQEKELVAGKRFLTKLWNASKFVFMNIGDYNVREIKLRTKVRRRCSATSDFSEHPENPTNKQEDFLEKKTGKLSVLDKAIISKLNSVSKEIEKLIEDYRFPEAKVRLEQFFWHIFCDDYLEIVKRRIYSGTKEEREAAKFTLYTCLFDVLKLASPLIPHMTEDIYQMYFRKNEKEKSIHLLNWPDKKKEDKEAEKVFDVFSEVLGSIRKEKSRAQKSMKAEIILSLEKEKIKKLKPVLDDLKAVVSAKEIKEGKFKVEFV